MEDYSVFLSYMIQHRISFLFEVLTYVIYNRVFQLIISMYINRAQFCQSGRRVYLKNKFNYLYIRTLPILHPNANHIAKQNNTLFKWLVYIILLLNLYGNFIHSAIGKCHLRIFTTFLCTLTKQRGHTLQSKYVFAFGSFLQLRN